MEFCCLPAKQRMPLTLAKTPSAMRPTRTRPRITIPTIGPEAEAEKWRGKCLYRPEAEAENWRENASNGRKNI